MPERQTKNAGLWQQSLFSSNDFLMIDYSSGRIMLQNNYGLQSYITQFTEEEMNQDKWHEFVVGGTVVLINFFYYTGAVQQYKKTEYYYDRRVIERTVTNKEVVPRNTMFTANSNSFVTVTSTGLNPITPRNPDKPIVKEEPKSVEVKPEEKEKPKVYIRPDVEPSRKFI